MRWVKERIIQQPQTIIFDFDYTLADSSTPVISCVNYALRKLGLPEAEPQAVRRLIGYDLHHTFDVLAGERADGRGDDFLRLFQEYAELVMVDGTVILEHASGALEDLSSRSKLGILSSKGRHHIEPILRREGLLRCFHAIVGGKDVTNLKPHPEGLDKVLDALGATPDGSIYVGDSLVDAETAQRAGVDFVAVLSGVTAAREFDGFDNLAIIENVAGLPGLFGAKGA
jgi:phosphoglycolate phosphatase